MNFKRTVLVAALALGSSMAGAQTSANPNSPPGGGSGMPLTAAQQQSMVKLQQAADRLRDAVAAMRGKQSATDRDRAIAQTQDALHATQQAMRELPAEIRNAPAAAITPTQYEASVDATMRAAEALRQSIQAMAKLPAGDARSNAIAQANQALVETHAATMAAYGAGTDARKSASSSNKAASRDRQTKVVTTPAAVLVLLPTAVVGPKATVTTYDNENFRERTAVLRQGQSVPNLRDRQLGWFEEVKSARVSCVS